MKKRSKQREINIKELRKILKRDAKEFASLYEIGRTITSTFNIKEILDLITKKVSEAMKADVCTLRLLEGKGRLVLRSACGLDEKISDLEKDLEESKGVIGQVAKEANPIIIKDLWKMPDYKDKLFVRQKRLRSLLSVPLVEMERVIGTFSVYSKKKNFYKSDDKKMLTLFASQAAIAIENTRLFEKTRSNYINTIRFFASIIDAKDSYTADHSSRVMRNVLRMADRLSLSGRQKEILRYASFLHDIGKISIDTSILSKPGPLTEDEWKQITKHPVIGSKIIKKIGFLDDLIPVIMYHHERYSGGGYPDGSIKGEGIPLEARILAIADAYEAMTSGRPYKKAVSQEEAIEELRRNAGTQFDPNIVELFINILKESK